MKKYLIVWETDYCEYYPEITGEEIIEASSEEEAERKFADLKIPKAIIFNITEVTEQC